MEVRIGEGEGDRESPKGKSTMPEWMEKELEKRNPTPKDPRVRLEDILARA